MKINGLTLQERKRWTANGWQSYFVGADYTGTACVLVTQRKRPQKK